MLKGFSEKLPMGSPRVSSQGMLHVSYVMNFMPYSFLAVQKVSETYERQERRFNYTTPKSFLELIALFRQMLAQRRKMVNDKITKLSDGVIKLERTADGVGELEEEIDVTLTQVGTPLYCAPEVTAGERYDEKADVFSMGLARARALSRRGKVSAVCG